MNDFDIIVIGGGHAGCEACLAAARMGANTALVTLSKESIARMSCNPSIGGIAKSHLVFELDALGGEMAKNTDYTGIQFRVLNTKKGPAVRANRAQCDKDAYSLRMQDVLKNQPGLTIIEGEAVDLIITEGAVRGIKLKDGQELSAKAVVLTAGTFLNGTMFIGDKVTKGGRINEQSCDGISEYLKKAGFEIGRLKTGTPPRLHKDSIDYSVMERQDGEVPPPFFSWEVRKLRPSHKARPYIEDDLFHVEQTSSKRGSVVDRELRVRALSISAATTDLDGYPGTSPSHCSTWNNPIRTASPCLPSRSAWTKAGAMADNTVLNQLPCFLTHTTGETHRIIQANLGKSALYGGLISGTGARYCPSIEDKVVKFKDKTTHHVFIEPEGRGLDTIYPNGISNSLPIDVQVELVHSIPGLEKAEFIHYAYAIEYDYCDPVQLNLNLETKLIKNLFFAGQINGTTGYEEAAAQGFMAGVNAVLKSRGDRPFIIDRNEAYIGVLIDDLVTKGTKEPYRMFTSLAERRLILRQDNARFRLQEHARRIGIIDRDYIAETADYHNTISSLVYGIKHVMHNGSSLAQILARPGISYLDLPEEHRRKDLSDEVIKQIEILIKYDGYIQQENRHVEKARDLERVKIPAGIDYWKVDQLRYEAREKFSRHRPANLGQALRIPGISPADISILNIIMKK